MVEHNARVAVGLSESEWPESRRLESERESTDAREQVQVREVIHCLLNLPMAIWNSSNVVTTW